MPEKTVAAHGAFRVKKKEDGTFYLSHLSYNGVTLSGLPRVVEEQIIESFFEVGDALRALSERSKH